MKPYLSPGAPTKLESLENQPQPESTRPSATVWLALLAFIVLLALQQCAYDLKVAYVDEEHHVKTVIRFAHGDYRVSGHLPMWPGFHLLIGGVTALLGLEDPVEILSLVRVSNALFSILAVTSLYRAARILSPESALSKAILLGINPLIFPYYGLAFTEAPALACLLMSVEFTLSRRSNWSGIFLWLAIAMRQSSVIWILLLAYLVWEMDPQESILTKMRKNWISLAALAVVIGIGIVHGGLIFNEEHLRYCPPGLYLGNPYFQGFTFLALFWAYLPWLRLSSATLKKSALVLAGLLPIYLAFFDTHAHFNYIRGYSSNEIIMYVNSSWSTMVPFYIPIAIGLVLLTQLEYHKSARWPLLAIATIGVMPSQSICSRYSIYHVALMLIFWQRPGWRQNDTVTALFYVSLTAIEVWLLSTSVMFFG